MNCFLFINHVLPFHHHHHHHHRCRRRCILIIIVFVVVVFVVAVVIIIIITTTTTSIIIIVSVFIIIIIIVVVVVVLFLIIIIVVVVVVAVIIIITIISTTMRTHPTQSLQCAATSPWPSASPHLNNTTESTWSDKKFQFIVRLLWKCVKYIKGRLITFWPLSEFHNWRDPSGAQVDRSHWLYLTHFLTTKLSVLVNSFCLNFLYILSFINWYNFVNIVRTERHTAWLIILSEEAHVTLQFFQGTVYFKPTCLGTASTTRFELKNTSRIPLRWIPNEFERWMLS